MEFLIFAVWFVVMTFLIYALMKTKQTKAETFLARAILVLAFSPFICRIFGVL